MPIMTVVGATQPTFSVAVHEKHAPTLQEQYKKAFYGSNISSVQGGGQAILPDAAHIAPTLSGIAGHMGTMAEQPQLFVQPGSDHSATVKGGLPATISALGTSEQHSEQKGRISVEGPMTFIDGRLSGHQLPDSGAQSAEHASLYGGSANHVSFKDQSSGQAVSPDVEHVGHTGHHLLERLRLHNASPAKDGHKEHKETVRGGVAHHDAQNTQSGGQAGVAHPGFDAAQTKRQAEAKSAHLFHFTDGGLEKSVVADFARTAGNKSGHHHLTHKGLFDIIEHKGTHGGTKTFELHDNSSITFLNDDNNQGNNFNSGPLN